MFKAKSKEFNVREKNMSMNKFNQSILDTLVDINAGRWSSVTFAKNS